MKNRLVISLTIVIILVILLFANALLLGFTHRLMAFFIQWIIVFFLVLTSIDLIFFKLTGLFSVFMFILIAFSITIYFNRKQDLRFDAQMIFFNQRKAKVNHLVGFIENETAAKRKVNKDSLNNVISGIGFEELQIGKDYVALKAGAGYYGMIGFIYTKKPKPRVLFGEYVNPEREIDKNWYSIGN